MFVKKDGTHIDNTQDAFDNLTNNLNFVSHYCHDNYS